MLELDAANDVLGDREELQRRMDRDGYLFFRDVLDHDDIAQVRDGIIAWCREQGLLTDRTDIAEWSGTVPTDLAKQPAGLHNSGQWEWLARRPSVQRVVSDVLGGSGVVLPITEYHFNWPGKEVAAGIHQDGVYSHGVPFTVFWIPLVDIDTAVGGLAIAPRQHFQGQLHPVPGLEHPYIPAGVIPDDGWARTDYHPGDILAVGRWTPHVGQPNVSDRLRLSIDFRAVPDTFPRPTIGTVSDATDDSITVVAADGTTSTFRIDDDTVIRALGAWLTPPRPPYYVGKPVIVTHRDGTAVLVRQPYGDGNMVTVTPPTPANAH